jgi:hypothetical protein
VNLNDDMVLPIYLGYEASTKTYFFYFIKDKTPRFLVYVSYFYWGKGPQTALSLIEIPEGIEQELREFLTGNLSYEFAKQRRNSRTTRAVKVYKLPQQIVSDENERGADGGRRVSRRNTIVGDSTTIPVPAEQRITADNLPIKVRRKRRTKLEMQNQRSCAEPIAMDVVSASAEVIHVTPKRRKKSNH